MTKDIPFRRALIERMHAGELELEDVQRQVREHERPKANEVVPGHALGDELTRDMMAFGLCCGVRRPDGTLGLVDPALVRIGAAHIGISEVRADSPTIPVATRLECPRCTSVGRVAGDPLAQGYFYVVWGRGGEHWIDTVVTPADMAPGSGFGCGHCR